MEQHQIVEQLMALYGYNRFDFRYMYRKKNGEVGYNDPHKGLTHTDMYDHLDGKKTVSVYGREYHTLFMTIDIDEHGKENVFLLINKMVALGIPREMIYVSLSGNKGYHLDVYFDKAVLKSAVESFFRYMCRDPEIRKIKVECFPLYNNTIKIPLGVNFKTGNRCWFVDQDTLKPREGDYEYILGVKKMSSEKFEEIVYACNKKAWVEDLEIAKESASQPKGGKIVGDMTKNEPTITLPGQRHTLMCKKAVWLRAVGGNEKTIYEELLRWVDRQDQSMIRSSRKEIEKDAKNIARDVVAKYGVQVRHEQKKRKPTAVYITEGDITQILKATTKMARRVAFLICAYCRKYDECSLGFKRIEEIIGAKDKAAYRSINMLTELGVVTVESHGGMVRRGGKPELRANRYKFVGCNSGKKIPLKFEDVDDNFEQLYYQIMRKACDDKTIQECFTGTERKIIKEIEHG